MKPKVYVTQDVLIRDGNSDNFIRKFDLSGAAEFGELVILVENARSMVSTVPLVRQLRQRLAGFTRNDYLLPIGDPAIMLAAGAIASQRSNGVLNLLKWDRRQGRYVHVTVDINGNVPQLNGD